MNDITNYSFTCCTKLVLTVRYSFYYYNVQSSKLSIICIKIMKILFFFFKYPIPCHWVEKIPTYFIPSTMCARQRSLSTRDSKLGFTLF